MTVSGPNQYFSRLDPFSFPRIVVAVSGQTASIVVMRAY
jgi:hypothetical protein